MMGEKINTYELYDASTNQPIAGSDGDALAFGFRGEPASGDELELSGATWTVQRLWKENGQLVIKLLRHGVVRC